MRRLGVAVLLLASLAVARGAEAGPRHVTISDGFSAKGVAGSQAVVHLSRATLAAKDGYHGPPVTLAASGGDFAGFALVSTKDSKRSWTFLETTSRYVCGKASCGEDAYRRDSNAYYPGDGSALLPGGDYYLVLLGSPGATISVTVASSTRKHRPVSVPLPYRGRLDVGPADGLTASAQPTTTMQPSDRGQYEHPFSGNQGLIGIVWTGSIEYGAEMSGTLDTQSPPSCDGTNLSFDTAIYNDAGPLGSSGPNLAWTPMYLTRMNTATCFGEHGDAPVQARWDVDVRGLHSSQRAFGFYATLVAG